ncbi:histidine kinase [Streptomyces sp. NPDC051907]|uniref:sensor histidine kinase n=1 Tax=Streptomyces sp. NPDC051907 TaxID=3155284 RepID=UPI003439C83E
MAAGTEEVLGGTGVRLFAVGAAAAVLSMLRRRMPMTVLAVTAALTPLLGGFAPLTMLVGWSAGRRIVGAGRALAAFTVAYALFVAGMFVDSWPAPAPMTLVLFTTLYFLATNVVPGLASRYWTQRRTLLHTLQERNGQLLRERAMVAGQARLRERQRIAQDMHDSLGHQLALISVHTGALEVDPELTARQREAVGVLRDASVTAMHELREVVGILRDGVEAPAPADEAGRPTRGAAGIESLVEAARAAGNTVELRSTGGIRPLAAAADHAAYRIAQEALTNAYKHAPGAPITVELRYEPDSFVVEVVNGAMAPLGPGEVVSGGQGLTGLRERARLVGGMVHAGPADGGGFRVAGVLPYGVVEATPLVGAEDDFRQQAPMVGRGIDAAVWSGPAGGGRAFGPGGPAGPAGLGGPSGYAGAGGAYFDWTLSERELARIGKGRSRSSGIAKGCGVAAVALLALVVVGVFGLLFLMGLFSKGMIDPGQYENIKVGAPEDEVRDRLPSGDTVVTTGLHGKGPKEPEGSECLVLMSSEVGENIDTEPVFRFCFKDGKLIEKQSYEVSR